MKLRTYFINILLLLLTGAILFLLAEGVTRLVMPNSVKLRLMHRLDEKLGFRLVPGYEMQHQTAEFNTRIKINSEGLRDRDYPSPQKDANVFRILALGDSFTLGLGVNSEEAYPKVLESMLNRAPLGKFSKFEVINAGVDGYGTEQEAIYLRELLQRYRPDLVIVGLYSNDVDDVMAGISGALVKNKVKNRLYFLSYLRSVQIVLSHALRNDIRSELFGIYQDRYSPKFEQALTKTKGCLVRIRDDAREAGAETMIVIVPYCFEIDRSEWEKRGFGGLYTDDFMNKNMNKFSLLFDEFGTAANIPTLPLLPVFRKSKVSPLYFPQDPHWTRNGHRLAAESIYDFLKKRSLVAH